MSKTIFKSVQTIGTSFLLCTTLSTAIAQTTFTERGILETFHYDSPSPNIPIKEMVSIKTNTGKTIQFEAEEFTKKSSINLEHLTNKEVDIKYSINTTTPRSTLNKTPVKPTLLDIKAAPSTRAATTNTDWSFYGETIKGTRFFPVLMCKYSDSPAEVIVPRSNNAVLTSALAQQEFADAANYWKVNSQNNYELVTKVFGWYTLPFPRSAYFHRYFNLAPTTARDFNADCMNAASADGFKLSTAYGVIFIEEETRPVAYAMRGANLPKKNSRGTYNNLDGTVTQWTPKAAEVHLSNDAFYGAIINHELGHAIGLGHSFYKASTWSPDYGNAWDVVSFQGGTNINGNKPQYTLGYNRFKLGWLNDNQLSSYTLNSPAQTIKLETASLLQNVDKRLILLKYPNRPMVYSIELRGVQGGLATLDPNQQAIYFDSAVTAPAVIIHSHVTDPGTTIKSTVINPGKEKTYISSFNESVMLKQGESWTAPMIAPIDKAMFKITVDQVTDTGATVTVSTVVP